MIFQDPYASLNPRKTVEQIVSQPFAIHGGVSKRDARIRVRAAARGRRTEPRARQPVPARVLGRAAAEDRHRPRARAATEADRLRRARLGARRLRPGSDPQPPADAPGRVRPHIRVHLARPVGDETDLHAHRRHVPRARRRARRVRDESSITPGTRTPRCSSRRCPGCRSTGTSGSGSSSAATSLRRSNPPSGCVFHPRCPRFQRATATSSSPSSNRPRARSTTSRPATTRSSAGRGSNERRSPRGRAPSRITRRAAAPPFGHTRSRDLKLVRPAADRHTWTLPSVKRS